MRHFTISYGTRDPIFNNRALFPSFYRTIPDELSEMNAFVKLIKHFGWKWVGLIVSDDKTQLRAGQNLEGEMKKNGICLDFFVKLNNDLMASTNAVQIKKTLLKSTANVIVVLASLLYIDFIMFFFGVFNMPEKIWILNAMMQSKDFESITGDKPHLKANGDSSNFYEILKCLFLKEGGVQVVKVGSFDTTKPAGNQLHIGESDDLWGPYFTKHPPSQCNEPCGPGYRKSKIEGKPSCCYQCVPCSEGEITNTTDAQNCIKCSKYEKSNKERNVCIPKNINFLSYEDILGSALSSIAVIYFIICAVILGIFIKYRETPIVRANNRYLSCLLLISLMLCFLCTLLFIGRPTQICCLLRQVTFGIVFTISVSSVLAKTLTVIIAFNATKPGSKLKKYVGTQLAIVLVIICSLGEIVISAVWLASNPPFPEVDTFSDPNYIIIICNEGSGFFFFCIIGYIGTLALLSFIAAFLAKDFPDRFNEAKNITFSMLGFCSVWGAFVPAYLSSKGSRMVAVEIFAILSSSSGILGCIFIPKCYIVFVRPELNTKDTIVRKQ
ncbi:vomeronasal type-2 receptor 116-like [Xenopus tropicalis]|uniref:Vomeronasal type-2 receptor 116-like n=1 Tax=Xenopus tropicalis TaxID=8364 RepID=A0A8J1JL92_XENTR|nr:vomeronasal type-2 receptor 116-like [Xenopus tropicalis]